MPEIGRREVPIGFEVVYKFQKKENGVYTEEILETKKKIGDPFEDVPDEKLVSVIMGQFARRDIMVVGVDIFELSKKQVSFKESSGGIVVRGKKYFCDDTEITISETNDDNSGCIPVAPAPVISSIMPSQLSPLKPKPPEVVVRRKLPMRYEYFEPHKDFMADVKKRNLAFTFGKQYPIFEERQDQRGIMFGMLYVTEDDNKKTQILSDKLFVFRGKLEGGEMFQDNKSSLDYGAGVLDGEVPAIR